MTLDFDGEQNFLTVQESISKAHIYMDGRGYSFVICDD